MAVTDTDMGPAAPSGVKPLAQDNNTAADYYTSSYSHCAPPALALSTLRRRSGRCVLESLTLLQAVKQQALCLRFVGGTQSAEAAVYPPELGRSRLSQQQACQRQLGTLVYRQLCAVSGRPVSTWICLKPTASDFAAQQ